MPTSAQRQPQTPPTQRVLMTHWGDGARFFHLCHPQAQPGNASVPSKRLQWHVVALCDHPLQPLCAPLQNWLGDQWWGVTEGFHRFDLGHTLLTLAVGDPLAQLQQCDAVFDLMDAQHIPLNKWWAKALARVSRIGTVLSNSTVDPNQHIHAELRSAGFVPEAQGWVYQPAWTPRRRQATTRAVDAPLSVAVVGAGLAGASVAASLALRGHRVTVLDAAPQPAQGASGLPAGLMAPLLSLDDNPRSQLLRAGLRLTHQTLMCLSRSSQLRPGKDHGLRIDTTQPGQGGLLQIDASIGNPSSEAFQDWSQAHPQGVWHPRATWVRAEALVRAWLATPGVSFVGQAVVHQLMPLYAQDKDQDQGKDHWALLDAQGGELARAHRVVLANALGSLPLLQAIHGQWAAHAWLLTGVRGLITIGERPGTSHETYADNDKVVGEEAQSAGSNAPKLDMPAWPTHPINGDGAFLPGVPTASQWAFGATYELTSAAGNAMDVQAHHQRNLDKFAALLPDLAANVINTPLTHWQGERAVSTDRLPLLGPLDPAQNVWLCTGLGSRGLTLAALCAEQLAAAWHQEPSPLPRDLARLLAVDRFFKTK